VAWMSFVPFNFIVIKTKASFDGGQTWSIANAIPHTNPVFGSADPSLEFDNNGSVFLAYVDYDVSVDSGFVYMRKSTNGGLNWGMPIEVINIHADPGKYPIDRPWMSIDRSGGVNNGNIYITTMPPTIFGPLSPPYNPYFIRSTDGGDSFDQWKYLDATGWRAGSIIPQPTPFSTISKSGIFHSVYPSWVVSQSLNPQYIFASSGDAGDSFSYSAIVLPFSMVFNDPLAKVGHQIAADPTDTNHLVFLNLIKPHGDGDVFMWESFDAAITWSDSVRINDDPIGNNRMQDLVWVDFNLDGDLVVSWRDRRNGTDGTYATASEIWGAVRWKDSTNFSPNFKISDTIVAYDTVLASSGNDFMCIKLVGNTLNAVWGDTRDGKLNIWFQRMALDGMVLSIKQLSSENITDIKVYPNPSVSEITIKAEKLKNVVVFNQDGTIVSIHQNLNGIGHLVIDLNHLSDALYFVRVTTAEGSVTKKIIKQ